MYIDFSNFPAFIGVVVIAVILSFFGNFIGATLAAMRNSAFGASSEEGLKLMIVIVGCLTAMVPYKVALAFIVTIVATIACDSLKEASLWAYTISIIAGFLFTFAAGSSKK